MQPYFMPYVGYWQLLSAVDRFIVLDDVAFIRRGWVNRNRILVNGTAHLFTLPVRASSQNRAINELELATDTGWLKRFRSTLDQSYRKAPCFEETLDFLEPVLANCQGFLLPFLLYSIDAVADHLGLRTPRALASSVDPSHQSRGQQRILDLCRIEGATEYMNLPGGSDLYQNEAFQRCGVRLKFITPQVRPYPQQLCGRWWPCLSIIDVLMNLGGKVTRHELSRYSIDTTSRLSVTSPSPSSPVTMVAVRREPQEPPSLQEG
jgi:hypothetical protein